MLAAKALLIPLCDSRTRTDTVIPLSEPVRCTDGTVLTEVPVPKGTTIFLNLRGCNTNKALWGEDAWEWKPERWLKPLPKAVEDARIPGIYANLYVLRFQSMTLQCSDAGYATG